MRIAIVQLPGSTCERDTLYAILTAFQLPSKLFWHKRDSLAGADAVIIPGGFSYGDYLRSGAIARFSPIMKAVKDYAEAGGFVLGICNGFQILCELGLLPGALIRNSCLEFRCQTERLVIEDSTDFFSKENLGEKLSIPIAHGDGNYRIDDAGLSELNEKKQVLFRYEQNPNGSAGDIAGIRNTDGNVFGMMPHPERATDKDIHGCEDGTAILRAFLNLAKRHMTATAEGESA